MCQKNTNISSSPTCVNHKYYIHTYMVQKSTTRKPSLGVLIRRTTGFKFVTETHFSLMGPSCGVTHRKHRQSPLESAIAQPVADGGRRRKTKSGLKLARSGALLKAKMGFAVRHHYSSCPVPMGIAKTRRRVG